MISKFIPAINVAYRGNSIKDKSKSFSSYSDAIDYYTYICNVLGVPMDGNYFPLTKHRGYVVNMYMQPITND